MKRIKQVLTCTSEGKYTKMKKFIRKAKTIITQSLIPRYSPSYKLNYREQGIINFIDVGSLGGLPNPWRANAKVIRFLLNFEPNPNNSPICGKNVITYNTALWEKDETRPFYTYKGFNASGSSLFKQNVKYVNENYETLKKRGVKHLAETWFERSSLVKTTELKCRKLDNILKEEFPDRPFHFVKIDAQGGEYNILKGSQDLLLGSCIGLHLELFTVPLYEGIVLADGIEAYLSEFGFRMVKKFPIGGSFDSSQDCLFLKDSGDTVILSAIRRVYGL